MEHCIEARPIPKVTNGERYMEKSASAKVRNFVDVTFFINQHADRALRKPLPQFLSGQFRPGCAMFGRGAKTATGARWTSRTGCERLVLSNMEAAFRENAVDADLLPSLTAEDLKDLGITAVGHRRRLLDAIAKLRVNGALPDDPSTPAQTAGSSDDEPDRPQQSVAERRQVSVMFCDMTDSTQMSTRLDPEDFGAVIRSYQSCVAATITRFGGFVARYVGDGVLIYFGWPAGLHEDRC